MKQGRKNLLTGMVAAMAAVAGACSADADTRFSQRMVVSGGGGDPVCQQGSEWSPEDFVCRPSEAAPTAAQRSITITASGHAEGSVVVTEDGFGTGRPVLAVKNGKCPPGVSLDDGSREEVGVKAEFVITPLHGGEPRTVSAILVQPQPGRFLRHGRGRDIYALPALEQPLATREPVDLGAVNAGDKVKLRLLAIGSMTSCQDGGLKTQPVQAGLWGPTSTQAVGYLTAPRSTQVWDDTKVAPFKAVATISY
ncbi:MAG TPA: hypothetical protein VFA75_06675 [Nevskia sp.]|nr:hypothetical protein [Nevskia sp.]